MFLSAWAGLGDRSNPAEAHSLYENRLVITFSGLCMDVLGADLNYGAHLVQWPCNGGGNQRFKVFHLSDGYHTIRSELSNLCLDISGASPYSGAHLIQWPCHGADNQRFLVPCGTCVDTIKVKHSLLCLKIENDSTGAGAHVIQGSCTGTYNRWAPESPPTVDVWTYEPVGFIGTQARLNCGWHENCLDGVLQPGERRTATDWQNAAGGGSTAFARWKLYTDSPSMVTVGTIKVKNWDVECNSATGELYDRWGYLVGRELFYHTDTTSAAPFNQSAYAISVSGGAIHEPAVGSYWSPDPLGCGTTGPHTHFFYWNLTGWEGGQNPSIPNEDSCNASSCSITREADAWTRWLKRFTFRR